MTELGAGNEGVKVSVDPADRYSVRDPLYSLYSTVLVDGLEVICREHKAEEGDVWVQPQLETLRELGRARGMG